MLLFFFIISSITLEVVVKTPILGITNLFSNSVESVLQDRVMNFVLLMLKCCLFFPSVEDEIIGIVKVYRTGGLFTRCDRNMGLLK